MSEGGGGREGAPDGSAGRRAGRCRSSRSTCGAPPERRIARASARSSRADLPRPPDRERRARPRGRGARGLRRRRRPAASAAAAASSVLLGLAPDLADCGTDGFEIPHILRYTDTISTTYADTQRDVRSRSSGVQSRGYEILNLKFQVSREPQSLASRRNLDFISIKSNRGTMISLAAPRRRSARYRSRLPRRCWLGSAARSCSGAVSRA